LLPLFRHKWEKDPDWQDTPYTGVDHGADGSGGDLTRSPTLSGATMAAVASAVRVRKHDDPAPVWDRYAYKSMERAKRDYEMPIRS
jgi:hypothetical protein